MLVRTLLALGTFLTGLMVVPVHAQPQALTAPLGSDLESIEATLGLPRATWYNDADGDKVFDSLSARFKIHPVSTVVITLRHDADFEGARLALARLGIQPSHSFAALKMFAADLRHDQVVAAARLDEVRQLEWAQPGRPELDTATLGFGARAAQRDLGVTGSLDGDEDLFTAQDVTIAILDSGFDGTHVDLAGKFLVFLDTKDGATKSPYDSQYHGTHVAGIAGGLGRANPDLRGVAPGAAFVGVKIEGAKGGSKVGALAGVDWLLANHQRYNVRVSTISYGFGPTTDGTDALELAFDKLFAAGVLPFKSTGNSGPEPGTVTIPGGARGIVAVANMYDPGRTEAATVPGIPVVGQAEYDYGFRLSSSSSRGPTLDKRIKPDIAAPGSSINSVANGTKTGYRIASGTSMASPFAAASAALLFAADPSLNASAARGILFATAQDWGAKGPDPEYGVGRLDTLRAVQAAMIGRAIREGRPVEDMQAILAVEGPAIPFHTGGVLNEALASASFEVKDAKKPIALTLIHNGPSLPAPGPLGAAPSLHLAVLELRGPDGSIVRRGLDPSSRQQSLALVPTKAGTYTLEAKDLLQGAGLVYDVSAGLPPVEAPVLAELGEAVALAAEAKPKVAASEASTPGLGVLSVLSAAMVVAVMVRRRR